MEEKKKTSLRARADKIKDFRCKNLIAVIENPDDERNIGTIIPRIRNSRSGLAAKQPELAKPQSKEASFASTFPCMELLRV